MHRLAGLGDLRDKPSGTLRINTSEHAATSILWPALRKLLPKYPDIHVEVIRIPFSSTSSPGVLTPAFAWASRWREDMIAVPIGPPMRMAVVGAPTYLSGMPPVRTPRDLTSHDCINIRFLTHGGLYAWEFESDGHALNVRVEGRLTFNNSRQIRTAVLEGFGLACLPEDMVRDDIKQRRLRRLLGDWCPAFPGYHLYYPSRREHSPAFSLLVDALRYRKGFLR